MIISQCDSCGDQQPYDPENDNLFYVSHPTPDGTITEQYCSAECVIRQLTIDYGTDDEESYIETAKAMEVQKKQRYNNATAKLTKLMKDDREDKIDYQPEGLDAADLSGLTTKQMDEITGVTRK